MKKIKTIVKKAIFYNKIKQLKKSYLLTVDKKRRVSGNHQFTIVAAVYNVEKYLEDFFESIVNQTLKFEDHIHLIMVDDGSPDSSADIIKKWQEKYPDNIIYIKKENGGQSSARNLGMKSVKTEWVTFVDPDDFLDYRYFEEVDLFLTKQKDTISFISCNTLYYREKIKKYASEYYLKFCFKKNEKIVTQSDMQGCIQFSASSSFFKINLLKQKHIEFHENIKPNFEDAHFVNQYFIENNAIQIAYLKKAKYIYRKRADDTSSMNHVWKSSKKYFDVLKYGYLDLLIKSKEKYGKVPLYIQRTILSELTGYFKNISDDPSIIKHLTKEEKEIFSSLVKEIFQYIDVSTIEDFHLFGTSHMHKIGFLGAYKKSEISIQKCFIDDYNINNDEIRIQFFYYTPTELSFTADKKNLYPRLSKLIQHDFVDTVFLYEKTFWLPLKDSFKKLKVQAEDQTISIVLDGKTYENGIEIQKILQSKIVQKKLVQKKLELKNFRNKSLLFKQIVKKIIFYNKIKQFKKNYLLTIDKKRRVSGNHQFTIVAAVYNVEKYLEDFFESIVNQTLKFEDHIHLIMVDDGSPDSSADIIKKWQEKYPDNIIYIKKENGGQASARNLGMKSVKTEWVTFVDPDDFLDYRYFEEIDLFLNKQDTGDISLISCNFIFYYENSKSFRNSHPLKYRFAKKEHTVKILNMEKEIQLTVNSVLFKNSLLTKHNIQFHTDIRPSFEDGYFVSQYLIKNDHTKITFLKKAKYFYRKRSDGSSTLDTSWVSTDRYDTVLNNGYLRILDFAQKEQKDIPHFLQRTILYELMWNHRYLLNHSKRISHLTEEQKQKYINLLKKIFQYIEIDTIEKFELAGCWFFYKVAYVNFYKQEQLPYNICYIDDFDEVKSQICIHYFYYEQDHTKLLLNNIEIKPIYSKIKKHKFVDETFLLEKIMWIEINNFQDYFNIQFNDQKSILSLLGIQYENGIKVAHISTAFNHPLEDSKFPLKYIFMRKILSFNTIKNKYKNIWLFIDRDIQADDNAEHLYRYISKQHKEIETCFILRKNSHDWKRLKEEGFNLIPYGSLRHFFAYIHSKYLISSHADPFVTDYVPKKYYKDIIKHQFIFLQHGVIHTNLSTWLNTKKIDCFICTTPREYHSITDNFTTYKFTKKEVVLTGLPRHDTLLSGIDKKEKTILIMPTWREYLVGKLKGIGHERRWSENFKSSEYLENWKSLLHSEKIKTLCKKYQYKIVFFPHSNIQPYLHMFDIPDYIQVLSHHDTSIQTLFQKSDLMITDYSSVAFEMGLLQKMVIYFQFDADQVLNGKHTFQKCYFDYENDGFGPVCYSDDEVVDVLKTYFYLNGNLEKKYLKRMQEFFVYHDQNNCKRGFDAIVNLEKKTYGSL